MRGVFQKILKLFLMMVLTLVGGLLSIAILFAIVLAGVGEWLFSQLMNLQIKILKEKNKK